MNENDNRHLYHFEQFTLENYKKLLEIAKSNFNFIFFEDFNSRTKKSIILRHDLEFSPLLALEMAKIEYEIGVKSTTFVNLHSEYYNTFEKKTYKILETLLEFGNRIGLHFDAHFYGIENENDLTYYLIREKKILQELFNVEIKTFSFHNTNPFLLQFDDEEYSGLLNVYAPKFFKEIGYGADSTGYWRYENLFERLQNNKDDVLQILIHDGMWQKEVLSPRQRIFKVIDDNAAMLKKYYDTTLKVFGAINIDWDRIV